MRSESTPTTGKLTWDGWMIAWDLAAEKYWIVVDIKAAWNQIPQHVGGRAIN
jgi:hypothetical protein